jgi:hypothetical protein
MAQTLAQRVKRDPALLARALADPGLRSALPDRYLPPAQRASRRRNSFLRGISNPAGTLAGPDLVNAAHQISDSEFAPLLADIGNQEKTIDTRAATTGDFAKRYYGDLNNLFGSSIGAQDRANSAAVQGAIDRGVATTGAIGAADQAAQARIAQDAAIRGADVQGDSVANQATRTAAARQQATQESGRAQQAASDFGGAQAAFLRGLQGAAGQQGGELQGQIAARQSQDQATLGSERAKLRASQVGQFTDTLLKLRQQEADNLFTKAGLNLDQKKLKAASQPSASDQKTAADLAFFKKHGYYPQTGPTKGPSASERKTQQEIDFFNKHGYYPTTGPAKKGRGGAGGGATTAQVGDAQSGAGGAVSDAKASGIPLDAAHRHQLATFLMAAHPEQAVTQNVKTKDGSVSRKVVQKPATEAHDALWTSIALDVLIDGHVSRYNANRLHARGLKVEDLGYPSYTDYKKKGGGSSSTYVNPPKKPTTGSRGDG